MPTSESHKLVVVVALLLQALLVEASLAFVQLDSAVLVMILIGSLVMVVVLTLVR